ncbi:MAG: type I restriction endonuclease subunit R, partial [Firmicutes bacterium]|nr:type I restriction endonuclease subunit R [Bacillota bacterium]
MAVFNEDTRVKIPATIQFMRLGYDYLSLKDVDLHAQTRIDLTRLRKGLGLINGREFTALEAFEIAENIHNVIRNNDMGKAFLDWLINPQDRVRLIDFKNIANNDFAVVDELTFGKPGSENDKEGSFRPDITVMVNGIPLGFLEVKHPNNSGGIQAEFNRMLNKRLENPDYRKYFNMLQVISFSNNMEYESDDDADLAEDIKAGSFYTTPNGQKTTFSFFREEQPKTSGMVDISMDQVKAVLKDNHYSPSEAETPEFQTNLDPDKPCNRFITSLFTKERIMFYLQYG